MYTMTPTEDFILDFLPGSDGRVAIAAGFSGHGFKLAPLVGRIMAELATKGARGSVYCERVIYTCCFAEWRLPVPVC